MRSILIMEGLINVYHITPYLTGDIGKAINNSIQLLPEDAWICLRDTDTMLLHPHQGAWIQAIASSNPDFDLIGCTTNRLGTPYQLYDNECSDNPDIEFHMERAIQAYATHGLELEPVPDTEVLAGMFLLFRKSLWNEFKIEEKSIQFDIIFSEQLKKAGKKLGIAKGIYIFHLYRLGSDNPRKTINHLLHCQDFNKIHRPGDIFNGT